MLLDERLENTNKVPIWKSDTKCTNSALDTYKPDPVDDFFQKFLELSFLQSIVCTTLGGVISIWFK